MHFLLLALYTVFLLAWTVVDQVSQNLIASVIKGLVFVSSVSPGFQKFLETEITSHPIPIAGLPSVIRKTAGSLLGGMALRQIDAIDILELDAEGRLHSLIKPESKFNGLAADRMSSVKSVMPILLLDREAAPVTVDAIGPVLMTKAFRGHVRTRSIALLCDTGVLSAEHVGAPILLADRQLDVQNLAADSSLLNFSSALDGARRLLLKSLRGEALVTAAATRPSVETPAAGSLGKFLLKRMRCDVSWRSVRCHWRLNYADVQVLLDHTVRRQSLVTKSLGTPPFRIDVEVYNPRVALQGELARMAFDVVVTAPTGQVPTSTLFANPVPLTNVTALVDDIAYDATTGMVQFSKPRLADLQTALPIDPALQKVVVKAVNTALERAIAEAPSFDVKSIRKFGMPLAWWFLRSLKIEGGQLHVSAGIGRCEADLASPPRESTKEE